MSTIRANSITNSAGSGAPDFPNGLTSSTIPAANLTGDVAAARITGALNATGSAPIYACRAWVNFNGTGTVAIRASGNVSSITDNGTGLYTVNFTTAMPDANYSINCLASGVNVIIAHLNGSTAGGAPSVKTTSAVQVRIGTAANAAIDCEDINVSIFR